MISEQDVLWVINSEDNKISLLLSASLPIQSIIAFDVSGRQKKISMFHRTENTIDLDVNFEGFLIIQLKLTNGQVIPVKIVR